MSTTNVPNNAHAHRDGSGKKLPSCQTLAKRFRETKQNQGLQAAVDLHFADALDAWLAALDGDNKSSMSRIMMRKFAVAISDSLSIRDSIVVSLVADPDMWSRELLLDIAVHPLERKEMTSMRALLVDSFSAHHVEDRIPRCERGIQLLQHIADGVMRPFTDEVFAVAAYVAWWKGDRSAWQYVWQSLLANKRNTLAPIVMQALICDVYPVHVDIPQGDPRDYHCEISRRDPQYCGEEHVAVCIETDAVYVDIVGDPKTIMSSSPCYRGR